MGRHSAYTDEIAKEICAWIASGKSLISFCRIKGNPSQSMVYRWLDDNQDFREIYTRAREDQAEAFVDQMIEIADDSENDVKIVEREDGSTYEIVNHDIVQRAKLRIETRKWVAGKHKAKKYGREKLDVTSNGQKIEGGVVQVIKIPDNGRGD